MGFKLAALTLGLLLRPLVSAQGFCMDGTNDCPFFAQAVSESENINGYYLAGLPRDPTFGSAFYPDIVNATTFYYDSQNTTIYLYPNGDNSTRYVIGEQTFHRGRGKAEATRVYFATKKQLHHDIGPGGFSIVHCDFIYNATLSSYVMECTSEKRKRMRGCPGDNEEYSSMPGGLYLGKKNPAYRNHAFCSRIQLMVTEVEV